MIDKLLLLEESLSKFFVLEILNKKKQ